MVKRLVYLANVRLPTEKAHGYQICKMCEAFAQQGIEVTLLHPYRYHISRRQLDPTARHQTVFEYYGISECFTVQTLPNWDWVVLNLILPDRWFAPLFLLHSLLWGLYAVWLARSRQADLYYTRDTSIAFWLGKFNLPFVYEAHGIPKGKQRELLRQIARSDSLKQAVVLTTFIQKGLQDLGFAPEKIVILPDGADLSLFADLPDRATCRQQLQLPIDRSIIGYVGRFRTLDMEKGIPQLVQAIAQLPLLEREPLLLCVGGPMESVAAYREIAQTTGVPDSRLQFVDRVPNREVPLWIRACDVVTIPWTWTEFSAYFTSPMKLFEYMAAAGTIVASDLPAIREVLQHEQNAWLVEPGDSIALAAGLGKLLSNPMLATRLAQQAQQDVQSYTWHRRAQQIVRHLEPSG